MLCLFVFFYLSSLVRDHSIHLLDQSRYRVPPAMQVFAGTFTSEDAKATCFVCLFFFLKELAGGLPATLKIGVLAGVLEKRKTVVFQHTLARVKTLN